MSSPCPPSRAKRPGRACSDSPPEVGTGTGHAYWIGHLHRRRGYAGEAVDAVLAFAAHHLAPTQVVAGVDDWNRASAQLVKRRRFEVVERHDGFALFARELVPAR